MLGLKANDKLKLNNGIKYLFFDFIDKGVKS